MHRLLSGIMLVGLLATLASAAQKSSVREHAATKPATTASANLPSEDTVNGFMQQTFGYEPEVSWKILSIKPAPAEGLAEVNLIITGPQGPQSTRFYVTQDGKHAVAGELMPFGARPFAATARELEKTATGPSRGPADAPVTIVEFSDLQCPHCKEAQPILEKLLDNDKNVRWVFQNFPLPSHDWSSKAAAYADCVSRTSHEAFFKLVDGIFAAQSEITAGNADEKLSGLADQAGVKGADMAACAAKPETIARVEQSVALGKTMDVTATPTMFINGRKIPGGVDYDNLKKLVDFAAKQPK
jgi:protein-disulfide isomerase